MVAATRPVRTRVKPQSIYDLQAAEIAAQRLKRGIVAEDGDGAESSDDDAESDDADEATPTPPPTKRARAPRAARASRKPAAKDMSWLFDACMDAKKLKNKDYDLDAAAEAWVVEYAANASKGAAPASSHRSAVARAVGRREGGGGLKAFPPKYANRNELSPRNARASGAKRNCDT